MYDDDVEEVKLRVYNINYLAYHFTKIRFTPLEQNNS